MQSRFFIAGLNTLIILKYTFNPAAFWRGPWPLDCVLKRIHHIGNLIKKEDEIMKPEALDRKVSPSTPILTPAIRKGLIIYLVAAVIVPVICFIFGWRSLENIGTGFIYGSLGMALCGALIFAGNTVPAQLSKLSLPKYSAPSPDRHQEATADDSSSRTVGIRFFFTALICGAFLLVTGLFIKML